MWAFIVSMCIQSILEILYDCINNFTNLCVSLKIENLNTVHSFVSNKYSFQFMICIFSNLYRKGK